MVPQDLDIDYDSLRASIPDLKAQLADAERSVGPARIEAEKALSDMHEALIQILEETDVIEDDMNRNALLDKITEMESKAQAKLEKLEQRRKELYTKIASRDEDKLSREESEQLERILEEIKLAHEDRMLPEEIQNAAIKILDKEIEHYQSQVGVEGVAGQDEQKDPQPVDKKNDKVENVELAIVQSYQEKRDKLINKLEELKQTALTKAPKLKALHNAEIMVIGYRQQLELKENQLEQIIQEKQKAKRAEELAAAVAAPPPKGGSTAPNMLPTNIGRSSFSIFSGPAESVAEIKKRENAAKHILVDEIARTIANYIKKFNDEKIRVPERLIRIQAEVMRVDQIKHFKEAVTEMQKIIVAEEVKTESSLFEEPKARGFSLKKLTASNTEETDARVRKRTNELLQDCTKEAASWVPPLITKDPSDYIEEYNARMSQLITTYIEKVEEHRAKREQKKGISFEKYNERVQLVLRYMKHDLADYNPEARRPKEAKPSKPQFELAVAKIQKPRKRQVVQHLFDNLPKKKKEGEVKKEKLISGTGRELKDYVDNVRSKFIEDASFSGLSMKKS